MISLFIVSLVFATIFHSTILIKSFINDNYKMILWWGLCTVVSLIGLIFTIMTDYLVKIYELVRLLN